MASDRQSWLERAAKAARRGDLAKAAECYQNVADAAPEDRGVLQKLCDAQARAGLKGPACANLKRLAELYREDGDRVRAVAVLRRAARISPDDPALQQLLANWLLEQGLLADARPHIEAACSLREHGGDLHGARAVHLLVLDFHPQDTHALCEVLRLAEQADGDRPLAEDCLRVAQGFARRGEQEGFAAALRVAVRAAPEILSSRTRIERLAADAARAAFLPRAGELGEGAVAGVLRATILCRAGQRDDALTALDEVQAELGGESPVLAIAAGEVLTDLGRTARAAEVIVAASHRAGAGERGDALAALRRVLRREPGQPLAAERIAQLSPRSEPASRRPSEPAAPSSEPAVFGAGERARLLEARSLFLHGMLSSALTQLDALPSRFSANPEVRELRKKIRAGLTPPAARAGGTPPAPIAGSSESPSAPPVPGAAAADEEEWIIDLDGEEEEGAEAGREQAPSNAPPPAAAPSPRPVARPSSGTGMEGLGELLEKVMSDEDAETRYQMAIGLLEMGLDGQALPMLEEVARGGAARCVDAALLSIRKAGEGASLAELLGLAETALAGRGQETVQQRADLEVLATRLAQALGQRSAAREHLKAAKSLDPHHPGLSKLAVDGDASSN